MLSLPTVDEDDDAITGLLLKVCFSWTSCSTLNEEETKMIRECLHTNVVIANKQPCEAVRLRGSSLIKTCEKIPRHNESRSDVT